MNDAASKASPVHDYRDLSVVIPAYNEAEGISLTLEGLLKEVPGAEIIVIDDGSRDGTSEAIARFSDVVLLQHTFNRGYGAAIKTGMMAATRKYVAWFDADNEHRVSDLKTMLSRMKREHLAAVIAQRRQPGPSAVRGVGKVFIRLLARSLGFKGEKDMNCGLRVFDRNTILRYISLLPNTFSASLTSTMIMLERRYPLGYHTIELNPRIGTSKVTLGDGFTALLLVLRAIMLFSPMRIFFPIASTLFFLGGIYSGWIALTQGRGLPILGAFLMLTGIVVWSLGLIADQLSQMRLAQYEAVLARRVPEVAPAATLSRTDVSERPAPTAAGK